MSRDLQGDFMASGPKRRLLYCPSLERISKVLEDHLNKDYGNLHASHLGWPVPPGRSAKP